MVGKKYVIFWDTIFPTLLFHIRIKEIIYNKEISSYPFITSYTFIEEVCDHVFLNMEQETPYVREKYFNIDPKEVKQGEIIFIKTDLLKDFFDFIDPHIKSSYKIITGRSDIIIDEKVYNSIKNNEKVIHCWSVNSVIDNEKITPIPLGIQNKNWKFYKDPQGNDELFNEVISKDIFPDNKILLSFQVHTNPNERNELYNKLKGEGFIKIRNYNNENRKDPFFVKQYFEEIKRSKFVLCPWGNGPDCHRNWEVLYLGRIPITKKHPALESFKDLPILFLDNWDEIFDLDIEKKYSILKEKLDRSSLEKMFFDFWRDQIKSK